MIISFFGHRRFCKGEQCKEKFLEILETLAGDRAVDFYLGGYGAFDSFAYACCKEYKDTHPRAKLVLITPYITISYQQNNLSLQTARYDAIIYPDIEDKPLKFAITYRNYWMVDKADSILFYVAHDWGGAYQTYKYAKRKSKRIFNLADVNT